jgi:predicted RNA methylase
LLIAASASLMTTDEMALNTSRPDDGSFRDPDSQVVHADGRVLRRLSATGRNDWEALSCSSFFERNVAAGRLVATAHMAAEPDALGDGWAGMVEHERVPFVTYPFEWTFGMLAAGAALHLELLRDALAEGMTTKDGYAYNVQWRGVEPVFIDISSFTPYQEGPWAGYRQFCETFLNPLMLRSFVGLDFHPWLRGSLEGIPVQDMRRLISLREVHRPGVLRHVVLHALFVRKAHGTTSSTRSALAESGFSRDVVITTVDKLLDVVRKLSWQPEPSTWTSYPTTNTYTDDDRVRKLRFVEKVVSSARPDLVWDLGCNDGTYARVAATHASQVVAMDADHATVELLYRSLRSSGVRNVLPLVIDVADPSPSLGWRNRERPALLQRPRPDLVMCLALVHHLAIVDNIPLSQVVEWLATLAEVAVVEFVDRHDPMVAQLLGNKSVVHADYSLTRFQHEIAEHFDIEAREELSAGTRTLYALRRR